MARTLTIIFTLFGAYINRHGGEIWTGSLIKLLEPFGMSETAVRLALSRMSEQGLIQRRRIGRQSFYALTEKGQQWMHAGKRRGLEREPRAWDGKWRLLAYNIPEKRRPLRDALREELRRLGYGNLTSALWISPYDLSKELEELLEKLKVQEYVEVFEAEYRGEGRELAAKAWDIAGLEKQYRVFLDKYAPALAEHQRKLKAGKEIDCGECFAQRFRLMTEFIDIAMGDPMLPPELLPPDESKSGLRRVSGAIDRGSEQVL